MECACYISVNFREIASNTLTFCILAGSNFPAYGSNPSCPRSETVAERPVSQQTLREQFTNAEQLTKELVDHLEHNLLPKIQDLKKLVQTELKGEAVAEDITVRNHASNVLESARFADEISEKMAAYFTSINQSVARIIGPQ